MGNELKKIRGQIRQIVGEILPEVLASEVVQRLEKRLTEMLEKRLNVIDERQKDIQGYMVRQSSRPVSTPEFKKD